MTTIAFVRHGNTDWNIEKRAQGHMNNPLNEIGRKQAEVVALRLAGEHWDVMFSSDLLRARETAETIASHRGKPITGFDQRLREIYRGQIEGTIEAERVERWGDKWRELELGEESLQALRERGISFIEDMLKKYAGKKILVVTHGWLLGQTLKGLFLDETTGNQLHNTSVTVIERKSDTWEYILYDRTRHLQE